MMKTLLIFTFFSISLTLTAQEKYWVFFKDKDTAHFNPHHFFDQKAIARRIKNNLSLYDFQDIPVNTHYISAVKKLCDSVSYPSRWFNALAIYASQEQLQTITALPFVAVVTQMESYSGGVTATDWNDLSGGEKNLIMAQTNRMGGEYFKARKLTGKGVRIAIIDAGFIGFKETAALQHTVNREYVKATFDFIKNDENVFRGHSHGTMVASCIAGKIDTFALGLAPNAEFLLARTEKAFNDRIKEEERWIAAMEWADKNGADIINTSLGYTATRYFRSDMDGKKGLISQAATLASKKGIVVICSAGNEGDGEWKIIAAPGDADSILTVGAINPWTGIHASWSSYGPSADKRVKPNVSAFGNTIVGYEEGYIEEAGTSFAAPLVAGFAACLVQLDTSWSNYDIYSKIEQSADLYPYYDYAHGYGVPQASYFFKTTTSQADTTFDMIEENNQIKCKIRDNFFCIAEPAQAFYYSNKKEKKEMEERWRSFHILDQNFSSQSSYIFNRLPDYVFYHIQDSEGLIENYYVLSVYQHDIFSLDKNLFSKGSVLRVFYKGYCYTKTF